MDLLDGAAVPVHDLRPGDREPAAPTRVHDQPVELGMKFRAAEDGYITSLRFYKQANNVGAHVGHLWGPDGQLLATVPFTNETASGWQSAEPAEPGRDHQGHGLHRLLLLAGRLLPARPGLLRQREGRRRS